MGNKTQDLGTIEIINRDATDILGTSLIVNIVKYSILTILHVKLYREKYRLSIFIIRQQKCNGCSWTVLNFKH